MCKVMRRKLLNNKSAFLSLNTIVALLTLMMTIFTGSISYFGYKINKSVDDRNKVDWQVQQSKYRKEFWENINSLEINIFDHISLIGFHIGNYIISYAELLNEIERLEEANGDIFISNLDAKLNAAYASFISSYSALRSSLAEVSVNCYNNVLINTPMVSALDIKCWNVYLNEKDNIEIWKKELLAPYENSFFYIQEVFKTGEFSDEFKSSIVGLSREMGQNLRNLNPPSLSGLSELKFHNYPNNNQLSQSTTVNCSPT